ncbi:MAG: peptidase [Acidobacteriia bacterium]|nr:peptidase [Terriglobia bacterium]
MTEPCNLAAVIPDKSILFIFIDGLGLEQRINPRNPVQFLPSEFFNFRQRKRFPKFRGRGKAINATLGVRGLPQSATGQTTLLTGHNAARLLGRHLNGLPNNALRELLARESIFLKLQGRGLKVTFANAYQPEFFTSPWARHYVSVSTAAVMAAGLPLHNIPAVSRNEAVYQEFTNSYLNSKGFQLEIRSPERAGEVLSEIAKHHHFTFYEYFISDIVGHMKNWDRAWIEVSKIDGLLRGACRRFDFKRHTLLVTSDHGNLEDATRKSHTRNPVPFLALGRGAGKFAASVRSLVDIAPAVLNYFSIQK